MATKRQGQAIWLQKLQKKDHLWRSKHGHRVDTHEAETMWPLLQARLLVNIGDLTPITQSRWRFAFQCSFPFKKACKQAKDN